MKKMVKAVWCERLKKFITYDKKAVEYYATKRTQCSSYNKDIEQETRGADSDRFCNFRECFGDGKECLGYEGQFVGELNLPEGREE